VTAAAVIGQVLAIGAGQLAEAAWQVTPPLGCIAAVGILLWLGVRRELRRRRVTPCPCCTGLDSDDCTCRDDCGVTQCQAADPPDHVEGCGPGHNMLAYPSLACPACDWIAARMEGAPGDDTGPWPTVKAVDRD